MDFTLTRKMKAGLSVLGILHYGSQSWLTLENAGFIIPLGVYPIEYTWSPKFKRLLPLLKVPHRKGIRIHAGNSAADTKGCILLGLQVRSQDNEFFLTDSRKAVAEFLRLPFVPNMSIVEPSNITIQNDPHFSLNYFDEWNLPEPSQPSRAAKFGDSFLKIMQDKKEVETPNPLLFRG
jgi:hypothetical protein